jgi:hypothetical protein
LEDYRWFEFVHRPLAARFPFDWRWLAGAREWAEGAEQIFSLDPPAARRWLNQIRQAPKKKDTAPCPRVFVSHRQADDAWALRIAWLAWDEGFDYWLDVIHLDPERNQQVATLEQKLGRALSDFERSILTAAIIEMALLNCTHVLAVMTDKTKGSQWVPYEYGRTKDATPISIQASCWWDSTTLQNSKPPEYLYLGPIHGNESAIRSWLYGQKQQYPNCLGKPRGLWPRPIPVPGPLPTG